MASLPTGSVTFLFTDIEGSTRIWEREPDRMRVLLAQHDSIVRQVVEAHGGHVFKTIGDAFCVAFHDPLEAADAAIETQHQLLAAFTDFRVRAAIYTGPAVETDGDYFGPAVNRVARLLSAGHGGQILVDGASAGLIGDAHREDARLRLLGEHRLRDLQAQEKVFQVLHPQLPESFPPLNTLDIAFRRGVVRAVAMSGVVVLALTALTLVAVAEARRADKNADLALQGERRAIRGEKAAVINADSARRESARANREERAAKAASEQRRIALGVAVRERNKATLAAEKERLAKLAEAAQKLMALYQKAEAGKQRDLALTQLVRFHVANGDRFLESGGPVAGLPWYQRVLEITRQARKPERNARIRLASVLRLCPQLRHVLPHSGPIYSVAFSKDGSVLATHVGLNRLQLWSLPSGRKLGPPQDLPYLSTGAEFSPDGKSVLTGLGSPFFSIPAGRLEVRPTHGGKAITLEVPAPTSASYSPDGSLVFAGSEEGFAALYDASTGKQAGPRLAHPERVSLVDFLRGPETLVTGCADGVLRFWDAKSGRMIKSLGAPGPPILMMRITPGQIIAYTAAGVVKVWDGNGGGNDAPPARQIFTNVSHLEISRDGNEMAACDYDARSVRVWDLRNGEPLTPPLLHPAGVLTASFNPDGNLLVTSCDDGCVRYWDVRTGAAAGPPLRLSSPCAVAKYSPDGSSLLTGCTDGVARLWSGQLARPFEIGIARQGELSGALFTADGKQIITAGKGNPSILVSNAASGRQVGTLESGEAPWTSIAASAGGRILITTGPRRSVRLWNSTTLRPLSPLIEQPEPPAQGLGPEDAVITSLSVSPDRRRLYTSFVTESGAAAEDSPDRTPIEYREVSAWDLATGRQLPFPIAYPKPLRIATFAPDGGAVLLGGNDGKVRLYRLPDGAALSPAFQIGRALPSIVISPDRSRAAVRFSDSRAELWDIRAGKRVALLRHQEPVLTIVFSPNSRRVLTGSMDGTARLWSSDTGRPTAPPLAHPGSWVKNAAFSPDGTQIATVGGVLSDRGEARLWDSRTGEALSPLLEHPRTIRSVAFSSDGSRIVTAGSEGQARVWSTLPERRSPDELARISTLLSGLRFAKDGSPQSVDGRGLSRLFRPTGAP